MKLGERRHGDASAALCVPSALPLRLRGQIVELRRLYTRPQSRGKGQATALMQQITAEADEARAIVMLMLDDGECKPRLRSFYERNGFAVIQDEPTLMVRAHKGMVGG